MELPAGVNTQSILPGSLQATPKTTFILQC